MGQIDDLHCRFVLHSRVEGDVVSGGWFELKSDMSINKLHKHLASNTPSPAACLELWKGALREDSRLNFTDLVPILGYANS